LAFRLAASVNSECFGLCARIQRAWQARHRRCGSLSLECQQPAQARPTPT